MHYTCHWNLYD